MVKEDYEKMKRKSRCMIQLFLFYLVLLNVVGEDIAKKLRDKFKSLCQSKSLVNKLFLQKMLYHVKRDDRDLVMDHLNVFSTLESKIVSVDIKIEE